MKKITYSDKENEDFRELCRKMRAGAAEAHAEIDRFLKVKMQEAQRMYQKQGRVALLNTKEAQIIHEDDKEEFSFKKLLGIDVGEDCGDKTCIIHGTRFRPGGAIHIGGAEFLDELPPDVRRALETLATQMFGKKGA